MISPIIGGLFCAIFSVLKIVAVGVSLHQLAKKKWRNSLLAAYISFAFLYGSITGYEFAIGQQRLSDYEDAPGIR